MNTRVAPITTGLVLLAGVALAAQDRETKVQRPQLIFPVVTRQVEMSVVVQEKNGAPVRGLTARDFEIIEKGEPQVITSFSEETEPQDVSEVPAQGEVAGFHNQHLRSGGVTVILLDRLNTAWSDQAFAKTQVVKFLGQIEPTDRVGLYVLESSTVRVLHDFTSDAESLLRTLARHQAAPSAALAGSEERAFETGDTELDVFLAETARIVNAQYLRNRAENTCEALVSIANHLSGVRGRKNLIWVSSSFPLTFDDPVGRGSAPGLSTGTVAAEVQRATRAMSEAGIAVYPVDARGLVGAFSVDPAGIPSTPNSGRTMMSAFSNLSTMMPTLDTAKAVAENTGGRAFYGTNDIGGAIRRAVDDTRVTYLLGYSPSHNQWDGRFREVKVKVSRPGLEVRHRKGYIAAPLDERERRRSGQSRIEALRNPLEASGIAVGVKVEGIPDAQGGEVNLAIRMDPRPITLDPRGEKWEGTVSLLIAQSNAEGKIFKAFDQDIQLSLTGEMRERLLTQGMVLNKRIALRGDLHRLHVVLSDPPSGAVGSVIIPADKVRAAVVVRKQP